MLVVTWVGVRVEPGMKQWRKLRPKWWQEMNSTQKKEHITNIHSRKWSIRSWCVYFYQGTFITESSHQGKQQNKTPLAFIFLYILMSLNPNIAHWEGTCMQTSSFSFINDDLQIKPFGARSWHFPKQTMKSKDQSLSCSKQEANCCSKEWSWKWIPVMTAPKQKTTVWHSSVTALSFWVGSHVLMQITWPPGSDLGKQSRCWRWLATGTAGV